MLSGAAFLSPTPLLHTQALHKHHLAPAAAALQTSWKFGSGLLEGGGVFSTAGQPENTTQGGIWGLPL